MKKGYMLLLLPMTLLLSGCGNTTINTNNNDGLNKIEIYDEEKGFKTTFSYDESVNYSKVEKDDEDDITAYEFINDDLDVEIQMFYVDLDYATYNNIQLSHKNEVNYKEYAFNNFDGYTFGQLDEELDLYIILNDDKEKKNYNLLYVTINRMDQDEKIVVREVFDEKELQALFDTIDFEIVNNKNKK